VSSPWHGLPYANAEALRPRERKTRLNPGYIVGGVEGERIFTRTPVERISQVKLLLRVARNRGDNPTTGAWEPVTSSEKEASTLRSRLDRKYFVLHTLGSSGAGANARKRLRVFENSAETAMSGGRDVEGKAEMSQISPGKIKGRE
jgi:hypothetical protein